MEAFIEYLQKKRIDPEAFRNSKQDQYQEWEKLFAEVHPESFTTQKLFLINKIRREFPYKPKIEEEKPKVVKKARPVMRRKV